MEKVYGHLKNGGGRKKAGAQPTNPFPLSTKSIRFHDGGAKYFVNHIVLINPPPALNSKSLTL